MEMQPALGEDRKQMSMRLLSFRSIILGAAIVTMVIAIAVESRRPKLTPYVSFPISSVGGTFRIRLLVPEGWVPVVYGPENSQSIAIKPVDHPDYIYVFWNDTGLGTTETSVEMSLGIMTATRRSSTGRGYLLRYGRLDERVFDATYRQICESFEVIRQP